MSFVPPCKRPENDPEDWFIEKDGKQYPDDVLITDELVEARLTATNLNEAGELVYTALQWDEAYDALEAEAVKENLRRRRHAKDKCWTDCIGRARLGCLDLALTIGAEHGTFGGYYPEELRKIRRARDARGN